MLITTLTDQYVTENVDIIYDYVSHVEDPDRGCVLLPTEHQLQRHCQQRLPGGCGAFQRVQGLSGLVYERPSPYYNWGPE